MGTTGGNALARPRMDLRDAYYQTVGGAYIADKIAPFLSVPTKYGQIEVVKRESILADESGSIKRAPGGEYGRGNLAIGKIDYGCEDIGREHVLKDGEGVTISLNREVGATLMLRTIVSIAKEIALAAKLTTGWTGPSGNVSLSWADPATAKPCDDIADIVLSIKKYGVMPTALVCNPTVMAEIIAAEDTKARFPGSLVITKSLLESQLSALTGLQFSFEAGAVANTAAEGLPFVGGFVYPDTYAHILTVPAEASNLDPLTPSTLRTLVWEEDAGEGELVVEQYRDEVRRGEVYRVRTNIDQKVMDAYSGYRIGVHPAET